MKQQSKLLRIREASALFGVNPETLRRWDKSGKLKAVRVSERGDRRYRFEDIQKRLEGLQKPAK